MIEQIAPKLERIKSADANKPRKKIAILGAGMAGLVAAYELTKLGHHIDIYEANERIGGRAWTHRFSDGQYHEMGAMRFPKEHDHTRYYARECGLQFRTFYNHHDEADGFYFIKGILSKHSEWETKLLPELELTDFEKWMIHNGPIKKNKKEYQLLNLLVYPIELIKHEVKSNPFDLNAILGTGALTPRIKALDQVSLGEYLRKYNTSADAIELIGSITGLEVWWEKALTMFVREEIAAELRLKDQGLTQGIDEIIGGTDLLPSRIVQMLSSHNVQISTKHSVFAIRKRRSDIQLGISTPEGEKLLDYNFVICTIPYSILRKISLSGLTKSKMSAIRNLAYGSSAKVLLNTKNRFWETEYNIRGGGSQTDLINRQIYYPSDNVEAREKAETSHYKSFLAQVRHFEVKNLSKTHEIPGVLVGSYVWGQDARRLGALDDKDRIKVVIDAISNIHPEIIEKDMVKGYASISWDGYKYTLGAFCFMKPGDFSNYYPDTIAPEGNLYFAGEHCSLDNGWIQGAIISSLRAVEQIVEQQ